MKVKDLLKVLFDDQRVELVFRGVDSTILFEGCVRDFPDEYLEYLVSSCYSDNSIIFIGCIVWR